MNRSRRQDDPLAGFTEVSTLARGTTATVHSARDVVSGQRVAVKLLEGPDGGGPDRAAFEREARALGAVSRHPNVVTLHRAELAPDGRPLLVLELCDGSLADRLAADGPLSVRTVVSAGVAIAGALETAHRAGVVHGDLKPRNLLVTHYGEIALADFGLTALRDAVTSEPARRAGRSPEATLLHAAPEVIEGSPVSPRSDVYSLASALFELLTGHPPFAAADGDTDELRQRVLTLPAPVLVRPGAPAALPELLTQALAKDPAGRPSTALEFAQRLRAVEQAAGWPATTCRVGDPDGTWLSPLDAGPITSRRGRAAAMTGLPPLQLSAPPLDPGSVEQRREPRRASAGEPTRSSPWRVPDPAGARTHLPAPTAPSEDGPPGPPDPTEVRRDLPPPTSTPAEGLPPPGDVTPPDPEGPARPAGP